MDNYIKEIIDKLNYASDRYYNYGDSPLSDVEYDKLYDELCDYESKFGIIYSNSPTNKVGAKVLDSINKINIPYRAMLSLEKCHTEEEISSFANEKELVGSLKMDGLSVRLVYNNGQLASAMTRGDSEVGQDITEHIKFFENVPLIIPYQTEFICDGEAIITLDSFKELNTNQQYKNARNLASGTLACLDVQECCNRHMKFIAWELIKSDENYSNYSDKLNLLKQLGFEIVPYIIAKDKFNQCNMELTQKAQELFYPIDGIVWKYQNVEYGDSLGRNAKCYLNAIAWKPAREEVETELVDIGWQIGRTGKITPVAYYKAVEILGSECEKASLHNLSIMEQLFGTLCPEKGTKIKVFKADMIIPQIASAEEHGAGLPIPLPEICPVCGAELVIKQENESKVLFCPNDDCNGKLLNKLTHYVSKTAMNIKGLSKETLSKLMDWNWVNSIEDLYNLKGYRADWVKKDGFGVKSVDNILNAIEESKKCRLDQFITALGIPLVGGKAAKDLCNTFVTWEEFLFAVEEKFKFFNLNGFGPEMHKAIVSFDYIEANKIATQYLDFETIGEETSNSLSGLTFVITGKLSKPRATIVAQIESAGGKVTGSVSSRTNYLVNNDTESTSSKNVRAKSLGVSIISEEEFYTKFGLN